MEIYVDLKKLKIMHSKLEEAHRKTTLILDKFHNVYNVLDFDIGSFDDTLNRSLLSIKNELEDELFCLKKHLIYLENVRICYEKIEYEICDGGSLSSTQNIGAIGSFIKSYVLQNETKLFRDMEIPEIYEGFIKEISIQEILNEDTAIIEPWLKEAASKKRELSMGNALG